MMCYKNDLFVSYAHDKEDEEKLTEQWLRRTFLPYFRRHLGNELGKRAEIFIDREGILAGEEWPEKLKEALLYSRCLIAFWAPSYFESEWCTYECSAFLQRESYLKKQGKKKHCLIPVQLSNKECFPGKLKNIQTFDCTDYFILAKKFTETELFVEFEIELKKWVKKIAPIIKNAPEWDEEWGKFPNMQSPETLLEKNNKTFNDVPGMG